MSETIITKTYRVCKQTKPINQFYKHAGCKNGHLNYCKSCHCEKTKNYRQTDKGRTTQKRYTQSEKFKNQQRRYYQSKEGKTTRKCYLKSEKYKTNQKRYIQSENFKTVQKHYRQSEEGKANIKRSDIKYNKQHPERVKARKAVNHAIEAGKLPRPDTLLCHYCPKPAQQYHHRKGYAPDHWLDVVPVCKKCHRKVG